MNNYQIIGVIIVALLAGFFAACVLVYPLLGRMPVDESDDDQPLVPDAVKLALAGGLAEENMRLRAKNENMRTVLGNAESLIRGLVEQQSSGAEEQPAASTASALRAVLPRTAEDSGPFRKKLRIACVTTCKGRLDHLSVTLPQNLIDCGDTDAVFIVLDYNDQDGVGDYIRWAHKADLDSGRLVYYRNSDALRFRIAHAKNQAHRCAMLEGADILVTLDADNFTGPGFVSYLANQFRTDPTLSFMAPDFTTLPPRGHRFNPANPLRLGRGFAGRIAIRTQDFIKAGGYNEVYDVWGAEDIDLTARLNRLGFKKAAMPSVFLNAISHSSKVRFREYPEAEQFENDEIYEATENAHDTVVNNGNIGCGGVYRNFSLMPIELQSLPTRIFGIGLQRTGTSSLHEAFQLLGFDSGHWKSGEWARAIWWEMNKWGRSRTLEQDYALCDNPIPMLYERLDKAYPGSKFILTVRDEEAWIKSIEKFWTFEGNPRRWTWDIDGFSHKMHAITYGTAEFDEQIFRTRYRRHNLDVEHYFHGRSDFLRLEIGEDASMAPLCQFLNLPVIDRPFPHENKGNGT